jgi:hypothetical protein
LVGQLEGRPEESYEISGKILFPGFCGFCVGVGYDMGFSRETNVLGTALEHDGGMDDRYVVRGINEYPPGRARYDR